MARHRDILRDSFTIMLKEKAEDSMNITEASYKVDNIVGDLFLSFDKEQVEAVFAKYEIADFQDRIELLRKCMKVVDTSNTQEDLTVEDDYHDELEIFVNASWRFLI